MVKNMVEQAGGKLLAWYMLFGEYNWITVYEMPSGKEAAGTMLAVAGAGVVTDMRTMLAMTGAEAKAAFETGKSSAPPTGLRARPDEFPPNLGLSSSGAIPEHLQRSLSPTLSRAASALLLLPPPLTRADASHTPLYRSRPARSPGCGGRCRGSQPEAHRGPAGDRMAPDARRRRAKPTASDWRRSGRGVATAGLTGAVAYCAGAAGAGVAGAGVAGAGVAGAGVAGAGS